MRLNHVGPRALLVAAALAVVSAASAQPSPTAPRPVAEERATKDDYSLDTSHSTTKIKVGEAGKFSLVITPKNGKKVHPDAPLEVTFKDSKGNVIVPNKKKLGRADVADKKASAPELTTGIKASAAGAHALEASVSFFLCTDAWCQRMSDRVTVDVVAE